MATIDPNKPWLNEGFSLNYNPFYANQIYSTDLGNTSFRKVGDTWYQAQEIPKSGDMDFSPTQYNWVPYQGDPSTATYNTTSGDYDITRPYTAGWEYGVNFDTVNQNNPDMGANWNVYDGGGFLRDGMGYTQFKVVQYDPATQTYITMSKTGDKEGTLQMWAPDGNGGMKVVKNLGTQYWDTNKDFSEQTAFQIFKVMAPMIVGPLAEMGWSAFATAYPEAAASISSGWANLTQPVKDFFGSIDAWAKANFPESFAEIGSGAGGAGAGTGSQLDPTGLEEVINGSTQPPNFNLDLGNGTGGLEDVFNPTPPPGGGNPTNVFQPGGQGGPDFVGDPITITPPPPPPATATTPVPPIPVPPPGGGGPTPNPTPTPENPPPQQQQPNQTTPKKGDITFKDGAMMIWNGTKWVTGTLATLNSLYRLLTGGGGGPGGGPGGSMDGNGGFLGFLFDMLGQAASGDRQENTADKLLAMYNDQVAKAQPWEEKLARSYTDQGQQDIMNSPAFMNAQYQYKQGIDRKAAKAGTLTNPESGILGDPRLARGRSAALQRYGLEYLDEYRKPIQQQVDMYTKNASDYKLLAALGLGQEQNIPSQWANTFAKYRNADGSFDFGRISKEIDNFGGNIGAWYDWLTQEPGAGQGAGSDEAAIEFQQKFPGLDPTPENLAAYYDNYDFWQQYFSDEG